MTDQQYMMKIFERLGMLSASIKNIETEVAQNRKEIQDSVKENREKIDYITRKLDNGLLSQVQDLSTDFKDFKKEVRVRLYKNGDMDSRTIKRMPNYIEWGIVIFFVVFVLKWFLPTDAVLADYVPAFKGMIETTWNTVGGASGVVGMYILYQKSMRRKSKKSDDD